MRDPYKDPSTHVVGPNIARSLKNRVARMTPHDELDQTQLSSSFGGLEDVDLAETAAMTPDMSPSLRKESSMASPRPTQSKKSKPPKTPAEAAQPMPKANQRRRARLRVSRVDPWSIMKTTLLFSVAGWIMMIVATWIIFAVLDMTGLYEAINSTMAQIFASPTDTNTFNIRDYVNTTRATALAALVGAVNVVIMTALATVFAFLYNLAAVVMGGVEITMAED